MRRSAQRRTAKYEANTNPERLKINLQNVKPLMVKSQTGYFLKMASIEEITKNLIENEGIPVYNIPNYLFFAREIYRISHTFNGLTLSNSGQERLIKWISRGLDEDLLIKVAALQGVALTHPTVYPPPPILDGDAALDDVLSPKTFYNTDAYAKRTGTLALTGNALVTDVYEGKTFYKNDAKTKLTGTLPIPPTPPASDTFGDMHLYAGEYVQLYNLYVAISAYPAWNGNLNSIIAYLKGTDNSHSVKVKAMLYDASVFAYIAESTEIDAVPPLVFTLKTFTFPTTPSLVKNRNYVLVVWGTVVSGTRWVVGYSSFTTLVYFQKNAAYGTSPTTLTGSSLFTGKASISALYTPSS